MTIDPTGKLPGAGDTIKVPSIEEAARLIGKDSSTIRYHLRQGTRSGIKDSQGHWTDIEVRKSEFCGDDQPMGDVVFERPSEKIAHLLETIARQDGEIAFLRDMVKTLGTR